MTVTVFPWSSAELEYTGRMLGEPGTEWSLQAVSELQHNSSLGVVREKYDGCGAGVNLGNSDGATNAYLLNSSPGSTRYPTTEYSIMMRWNIRELPSDQTSSTFVTLSAARGGTGGTWWFFLDPGTDRLRIQHDGGTLTTEYIPAKDRDIRILIVWDGSVLWVFEDGVLIWSGPFTAPVPGAPTSLEIGANDGIRTIDGIFSEGWISDDGDLDKAIARASGPLDYASGVIPSDIYAFWPVVSRAGPTVIDETQQVDLAFTGSPGPDWCPATGIPGPMEGEHPRQAGSGVLGTTKQLGSGAVSNAPSVLMSTLDGALQYSAIVSGFGAEQLGQVRARGLPVPVPIIEGNSFTATNGFQFLAAGAGSGPVNRNDEIRYDDTSSSLAARDFFARLVDRPVGSETVLRFTGTVSNNTDYTVTNVLSGFGDLGEIRFEVTPTPVSEGFVTATCVEANAADAAKTPTMDVSEGLYIPPAVLDAPTADFRTQQVLPVEMLRQLWYVANRDAGVRLRDAPGVSWLTDSSDFGSTAASGFLIAAGADRSREEMLIEQLRTLFGYLEEAADGTHTLKTFSVPNRDDATITVDEMLIEGDPRPLGRTPPAHSLRVTYRPNYTIQSSPAAGLDAGDASYWARPYEQTGAREQKPQTGSVAVLWRTNLARRTDAEELRDSHLWPFYTEGGGREWFEVPVSGEGSSWEPKQVAAGETVILRHPRHGLARGRAFFVQRLRSNRMDHRAILEGFV